MTKTNFFHWILHDIQWNIIWYSMKNIGRYIDYIQILVGGLYHLPIRKYCCCMNSYQVFHPWAELCSSVYEVNFMKWSFMKPELTWIDCRSLHLNQLITHNPQVSLDNNCDLWPCFQNNLGSFIPLKCSFIKPSRYVWFLVPQPKV